MTQKTDYREFLKIALAEKFALRPGYSMRAFARHVGISASHLSRVLNGKKDLSPESATRIAVELNLSEDEQIHFLDLVSLQSANSHTKTLLLERIRLRDNSSARRALAAETFKVISDWYYFPLIELTRTHGFRSEPGWIAKKLGLTVAEVEQALLRLQSLGLIKVDQNRMISTNGDAEYSTPEEVTHAAVKKHHEQMANKAILALNEQSVDEREFQGVQLAFNRQEITKARQMIREFAGRFEAEFRPRPGEDVYQFSLQFFNLTKKRSE